MKRLRFCMVPIAAMLFVLLAMSFAWARVVDFRANVTPTVVKTGDKAYLVVELLNDQGKVDPFGYQEVDELKVQVASLLGNVVDYNSTIGADDKGVVLVTVDYDNVQPGTDTISVTLKEKTVNSDTGMSYWSVIKSQTFNVTVQQAANTARSVEVTDISLPQAPVEDEATSGNYTHQKCTDVKNFNSNAGCIVEAGNPFIINLKACSEQPYNGTCSRVSTQNSDVYVYLVGTYESGDKTNHKVENNYATTSDIYEFTGSFVNGVASISVPADTVTKAGKYKIYITTSGKKNSITGITEAIEQDDYYVKISPRQATKIAVAAKSSTVDQKGKAWCWRNATDTNNASSVVVAKLLDKYGNIADQKTGIDDDDQVKLKIKDGIKTIGEIELGQNVPLNATILNCNNAEVDELEEGERLEYEFTVDITKDDLGLEQVTETLPVNIYADYITLNATAFAEADYLGTSSGLLNSDSINSTISAAGNSTGVSNGTNVLTLLGDSGDLNLKVTFFGTNEQSITFNNATNGTIRSGNLQIENLVAGYSDNSTCVWLEDDDGNHYLPKICSEFTPTQQAKLLSQAAKKDIKIYQIKSFRYFANGTSQVDFEEVTGDITLTAVQGDKIALTLRDFNATADSTNASKLYGVMTLNDNNATVKENISSKTYITAMFPEYTARVVDSAGNFANSTELEVTCLHGDNSTAARDISGNKTYITWSDTTITEDTCTFKAGSLTKTVTVHLDWSAGPDHVNIDVPNDYILTTSKAPLVLSLRNADDTIYDTTAPGNYTIYISDPSLVRVYTNSTAFNSTYEIKHGDEKIVWDDGKDTIFIQTLSSAGDVTITIKNSAGTVTGSKTLHIVESASNIPVTVGSVTTSPASLTLAQQEEGTLTATVKDTGGNPVSGIEVSAESDNTDIATVSTSTCTTDANGECDITIVAGNTVGTAHVTLTAQGQSAVVDVEVTEQQAQCDADHLDLCTTEEDCTAAGGYWYDDACHETQQQQPQPVPTEPTTQEITDVSTAPVNLGAVAAGTGDTMEMAVNFPAYENAVDIYVGILLPTGDLYVLQSDNTLTPQLAPYADNVTEAVSAQIFEPFTVCTPFGPAITEGTYYVFSLVVPTGTDLASMNAYDLRYYSFNVSCGD